MKFLLMIALAMIVSCSKSPDSQNNIIKDGLVSDNNQIDFGEVKISVPISGAIPSSSLDFASLEYKQSGTQDLQITYSPSSGSLTLGSSDFDTSLLAPFTIQSNGCLTTLLPRKSCVIKFQLSNSQSLPSDQNLTSLIKIKGSDISLTGILKQDLTDYSAPAASFSVSPLFLNFGSFKNGESKELSIAVKNNGSAGSAVSISSVSNPNVSISYNSCPVSPLLLGARVSCVVRLKYLGAAAEVKSNENLIKIANYQVTHSATVTSPSVSEPETLAIEPQVSATAVSMSQPDNQSRTISFTNTGTLPLVAPVSAVSSDNGIQIVSVSCAGGLARSKICDISYNIISAQLPSGSSTQTIRLQSGTLASNIFSLNLDIVPNEVLCALADAQANGVNLSNSTSAIQGMKVGNDVSQCILSANACNQYYSLSGDSKSCSAQTLACSASDAQENGWTITSAATYSGNRIGSDVSSCNVLSCASNYEINGKDCTAIACTQANSGIANVLTVTGTKVSGCFVATCLNEYEQVGNTCVGSACTTANAQGNGLSSILNVATVSGNINDDSCLVATCDQYYKNALDNKSCSPKLCNELNGTELSSLGYNLTGATISGTYNSCTVSCNSAFQQVAVDGKSCEDKTPTGTISFAQDHTKLLTPNVVNLTSSNAQSIQFYSDAGCLTPAGVSLSLPLSSTNLTLSPGDGTKTVYAKFINGSKTSSCMSDSIVLDTTGPILTITSPANNSNITANSIQIAGSCGDASSVNLVLSTINQNIACSSGSYTFSSVDISTLITGTYSINISATDSLGNNGSTTNSINILRCNADQEPSGSVCVYKNVLTPEISISNSYIHNSITYVSSSSLTFSLGTTQNAKTFVVFDFLSDCNNELVGSCPSNPLNPACNSLNRAAFDVTMSMIYSPTIIPNSAKTIYGYYTNGDKKTSCISKTFTYNNPVVAVSSTKPIEVIKTISNFVPTYVNLGLAVTNDIKVNGTNLNIAPTTVTGTNANGSFQSAVLAVPYDNLSSGITTTLSGTASAGKITECDSNIFGVGFNCSFTDTTFSSILDTYYISENGYTPIYLFLAPNHSKVVPYKIYKSTMLPIRTGNLADVITTGTLSMYPINFNNELYFIGNNASVNTKLMKTNGTTITEVASGIGTNQNSGQTWPVVYNGELFLSLKDAAAVNKIYKTDGATYFKKAMEIRVTASPDTWREPIVFENSIFFSSSNGTDQDIYRYNGTNPVVFSNIRTGSDFSIHLNPFVFGSRMYFRATANGTIANIYHTSSNLIKLFSNLNASVGVSHVTRPVLFNGFMYFSSYAKTGTVSEFKLYKTDGTTITQVTNLHSLDTLGNGTYGEYPYNLISHNGFLYFNGQNSSGYFKLYKLDTTDKITEISNTNPSGNDVSFPLNVSVPQLMTYPVVCNGELFAIMNNSSGLSKIFKVEASRVVQVTDIRPGLSDSPLDLACSNNILYFKAGSPAGTAAKLWKLETEIIQ